MAVHYHGSVETSLHYHNRPARRYEVLVAKLEQKPHCCIMLERAQNGFNLALQLALSIALAVIAFTAPFLASRCWCTDLPVGEVENWKGVICLDYPHGIPTRFLNRHHYSIRKLERRYAMKLKPCTQQIRSVPDAATSGTEFSAVCLEIYCPRTALGSDVGKVFFSSFTLFREHAGRVDPDVVKPFLTWFVSLFALLLHATAISENYYLSLMLH